MKILLLLHHSYHRGFHFFKRHELFSSMVGLIVLVSISLFIHIATTHKTFAIFPHAQIVAKKTTFKVNEPITFTVALHEQKITKSTLPVVGSFITSTATIHVAVYNNPTKKNVNEIPIHITNPSTESYGIAIDPNGKKFRPGYYTVEVAIEKDGQTKKISQAFYYGVLAINTNKSIFVPHEKAYIQIGALNSDGHTLCDANLALTITSPNHVLTNYSTRDNTILASPTCGPNNVTDVPDYSTDFVTGESGTYTMDLINADTGYTITDTFVVKDNVPFIIERTGATRLNPYKSTYVMHIAVTAPKNTDDIFTERIPFGFKITPGSYGDGVLTRTDSQQLLSWHVHLEQGQTQELKYTYLSPQVSPEFYELGPASISDANNTQVFIEAREWELANDNACVSNGTGTWVTTARWTTCGSTFPGSGDTAEISNSSVITIGAATAALSIKIDATGTLNFSGTRTVTLGGTSGTILDNSAGGTYTTDGAETIDINGAASVTATAGTLTVFNLTFNPAVPATTTDTYTLGANLNVNGAMSVNASGSNTNSNLVVNLGGAMTVTGTVTLAQTTGKSTLSTTGSNFALTAKKITVSAGGVLTTNGSTLTLNGTTTNMISNAGTITSLASTDLVFQPGASITLNNFALGTVHSFTFNASGFVGTLGGTMTDSTTLTVSAGTLADGGNQITGTAGQSFTVSSGATFKTTRTATLLPLNYTDADMSVSNGTIEYAGVGSFTLPIAAPGGGANTGCGGATTICYGNLLFDPASGARVYTWPAGTPNIAGNMTVGSSGGTCNVTAVTNSTILTVGGNLIINSGGTVTTHATNATTFSGDVTNAGTLTMTSSDAVEVDGSWTNSGTVNVNTSTVTFKAGTSGKTITCGATTNFNKLTFNNASGGWTFQDDCTVSGNFTLTAGTVTTSSGTLTLAANFNTSGGTVTATVGTIDFTSGSTITGTQTLNNLTFDGCSVGYTIAAATTLTTNGTLTFEQNCNNGTTFLDGSGSITALGNIAVLNEGTGQTSSGTPAVITISGTGNQTLSGDGVGGNDNFITSVVINKTSGTLTISNALTVVGNWIYTQGAMSATGSTIAFDQQSNTTNIITGTQTLNNVTFGGFPNPGGFFLTVGTHLTLSGNLVLDATSTTESLDGGANSLIEVQGNFSTADDAIQGNIPIALTGGNNQTLTFSAVASGGVFEPTGDVAINKTGGTATLATAWNLINAGQKLTISGGTLNLAGFPLIVNSTLTLNGTGGLKLQGAEIRKGQALAAIGSGTTVEYTGSGTYATLDLGTNYGNLTFSGSGSWTDATASAVLGNFTQSAGTFVAPASTLTVGGNFAHTGGVFTNSSGTVIFNDVTKNTIVSGATTFNNLTSTTHGKVITLPASTTQTVSGALTLTGAIHGLITINSSSPGTQANLTVNGSQSITGVAVSDSNACGGSVKPLTDSLPGNGGDNSCWSFGNYLLQGGELMNMYGGTTIHGGTTLKSN